MKNLVLAFLVSMSAQVFAGPQVSCVGDGVSTQGQLKVTLNQTGGVTVKGNFYSEEAGERFTVDCKGQYSKTNKDFFYYEFSSSVNCPVDYVRFPGKIEGRVALVNRTAGDNHDWSGYLYSYFNCSLTGGFPVR